MLNYKRRVCKTNFFGIYLWECMYIISVEGKTKWQPNTSRLHKFQSKRHNPYKVNMSLFAECYFISSFLFIIIIVITLIHLRHVYTEHNREFAFLLFSLYNLSPVLLIERLVQYFVQVLYYHHHYAPLYKCAKKHNNTTTGSSTEHWIYMSEWATERQRERVNIEIEISICYFYSFCVVFLFT